MSELKFSPAIHEEMMRRLDAENRKRDAAPEMYALLVDLDHEYGDEFIARAIWRALRARINGEVE